MNKLLMVVVVLMCGSAFGQAEPDWISKVRVPAEVAEVAEPMPVSPLDDVLARMEAAIADANAAAKNANDAADVAIKAANAAPAVKFDFDSDARFKALEDAVKDLQARKEWTEGEIRTLAKEEAEKVMKATVKTTSGAVKEVGASSLQVSVNGYSGTFEVKPGEVITHINGEPITQRASMQTQGYRTTMATTRSTQLQTVPQRQGVVRFWNLPSRSSGGCPGGVCPN